MSHQIDIVVDLGVLPPPLPEILTLRQLVEVATAPPRQIIDGILHQGCKMILGGTSKSNKSWSLLDLGVSVASGQPWWGRPCAKHPVLYINFELHTWAIAERLNAICAARPECTSFADTLALWNLRGFAADMTLLRPKLQEQLAERKFGLIIIDPAYKLLGNRDENANGDIASLMNEFEALCVSTGAAVVVAHHFAKGDSTAKHAMDTLPALQHDPNHPEDVLKVNADEDGLGDDAADALRYLVATKTRTVSQRKLTGV
jgi:RecA-family ATPase